ncbi:MAG TPA: hypothetical protein VF759_12545 [Allosphingosinicella sp.]|jgi:hypothetical protein
MEASHLLLEYLNEQYTQARQHETRQTAATTFLTAAAAAVLGLAIDGGTLVYQNWWAGVVVGLIGAANLALLSAHQLGNRYHTTLAGKVRREIEDKFIQWGDAKSPTTLRSEALEKHGLRGAGVSIGAHVYARLKLIPILVMCLGAVVAAGALSIGNDPDPSLLNGQQAVTR